jgi:syntaxin 1B/2/3
LDDLNKGDEQRQDDEEVSTPLLESALANHVQFVQGNISKIQENSIKLQRLHKKSMVETNPTTQCQQTKEINALIDETSALSQSTKAEIKRIPSIPGNEDRRIKQTQQKRLATALLESAKEYRTIQTEAQTGYRAQLARQYRITKPGASDEEVSRAIDSSNGTIFQQQILNSRVADQQSMLQDVQNRQGEVEKIAQSLTLLFELFQEMQILLNEQDVVIDDIEKNVDHTILNMQNADAHLAKGVGYAISTRKKKWILFFIVLVILMILAIIIGVEVTKAAAAAKELSNKQGNI